MRRAIQITGHPSAACLRHHVICTFRSRPKANFSHLQLQSCGFNFKNRRIREFSIVGRLASEAVARQPKKLNQNGVEDERRQVESSQHEEPGNKAEGNPKELQVRTPWHREGADQPPVEKENAGNLKKGKLLTTPSRLLKLIVPLSVLNKHADDIEPLALLVHPQQPLSYLERLIQSELPMITNKKGQEKVPDVSFYAEDSTQGQEDMASSKKEKDKADEEEGTDAEVVDGKLIKTGKISKSEKASLESDLKDISVQDTLRGGPGEGGIETYSGLGHESQFTSDQERKFVRWSSSTEIGDFIRDAARGKEFAIKIEGSKKEIRVGVPSFNDRTHYLRVRLRKTSHILHDLASLKKECDDLAHKSAQRLAMGGFGILVAWWATIYHITFQTDIGWDGAEPITYLVGLSSIMLGYLYFLWHNREVSYRSALHMTVSHRQNQLYTARGFDLQKWESLIEEANALRKEIKVVANEYDVEWDEKKDEASEIVHQALREERKKQERKRKTEKEEEDGEEEREEKKEKKEEKKEEEGKKTEGEEKSGKEN